MKKPRTGDPGVASASDERLCVALSCGATELLSGSDVLRVLRTSRLVRSDPGVVSCALRRVASDPRWRWVETTPLTSTAVQLAWRIQTSLSRELDKASGCLHPFLQPISADGATANTTSDALAAALPIPTQVQRPSSCGAHWDHIQATEDGCALCEACVTSVCAYREATEAFTSEFEHQLTQREEQWEEQGRSPGEVFDRSFAFQQAYFASEPFYSAYVANQDDAGVLAHIRQCGHFPLTSAPQDQPTFTGNQPTATSDALSMAARETCRRVYRPAKRLLTTLCQSPLIHRTAATQDVVAGACGRLAVGFVLPHDY